MPSQTDPQEGDYLAIDNAQGGTHKIPVGRIGVEVDDTLTEAGKAADAKATGDALDEIRSQIEVTGTASGAIATFADGADAPTKSCIATIVPKQAGSGTPSPENERPISGWESVSVMVSPTEDEADATTTTVNLGRTVYGGTLDVVSGVLTVTHGYMKYTNISTTSGTAVMGGWRCNFLCPDGDINKGKWSVQSVPILSMFDGSKLLNEGGISKGYALNNYTVIVPNATSKETADAILEGLELVYELATPQTYTLTGQEISTLLGENNVWADSGDVSVVYVRDLNIAINNLIGE